MVILLVPRRGVWAGKTGLRGGEEVVEAGVRRRWTNFYLRGRL